MTAKHTPGSWRVVTERSRPHQSFTIRAENGVCIAETVEDHRDVDGEANAHVIAAAPEMLDALEYLLEQTVNMDLAHGIDLTEGERDARNQALAIIAKARAPKITPFLRAYIAAALFSSLDGDTPLDRDHDASDLAPQTLLRMAQDCERFQAENAEALAACTKDSDSQGGHDFWLTRNGHGAGFWDAHKGDPWPDAEAETLTDAAHRFGPCELYVGDDGKIYAHG